MSEESELRTPLIELRDKLAKIRPSLDAGSISQIKAEEHAISAVQVALAELDPVLFRDGHLRWLEMLSSRLFDLEANGAVGAVRPRGREGRASAGAASVSVPEPLVELRQKLADIGPSVEAGSMSQIQAEQYALLAAIGALADLDPHLGDGHLRWLEMLSSRLFDLERREARPAGKRGRGNVDAAVEEVRCAAIAAKRWLVERFSLPHDKATAHVLACLNANEAFVSVHGGEVHAMQFENWGNKWLHQQPLSMDLEPKGISIPARIEIVRAVAREMSDSERPPLETVSSFLTAMCSRLPRPSGRASPPRSRIK